MVKSNIEIDIKVMCIKAGTTQANIAREIGTTPSYVNRVIRQKETIINKTFVNIVEALGYDVEISYVKRSEE